MYDLNNLKALAPHQYEKCKESALKRVQSRIGDKPTRTAFRREYAPIWEMMDMPLMVIFIAAFVISSLHIFDHMSVQAEASYLASEATAGARANSDDFVLAHQWAYVLLAEFSMLSFFTAWKVKHDLRGWRRWTHPLFLLALLVAAFVLYVNVSSDVGILEGIIPPLVTIGIGFRLEAIASELITRRSEIDQRYTEALATWEQSQADPTKHTDYLGILRSEIWHYLTTKLTSNKAFAEAPPKFRWLAVEREIRREQWTHQPPEDLNAATNTAGNQRPFGHTALAQDVHANMPAMLNGNAPTGSASVTK